jgi:hypothetical protein
MCIILFYALKLAYHSMPWLSKLATCSLHVVGLGSPVLLHVGFPDAIECRGFQMFLHVAEPWFQGWQHTSARISCFCVCYEL